VKKGDKVGVGAPPIAFDIDYLATHARSLTPKVAVLSRPSLRAYVTSASWSDAFVGMVAPVRYGDQTHGFAVGVQLETWW
jgi:maltoporin